MLKLKPRPGPTAGITNDRALVTELVGDNLAEAAMYLGKSRQALNGQLGSAQGERTDYLRIGEILVLLLAARQAGRAFDIDAVARYVEATRRPATGADQRTYALLSSLLAPLGELDLDAAHAVVLLLPSFFDLRSERPTIAERVRKLVRAVMASDSQQLIVVTATKVQAHAAAQWLGLTGDRANAVSHDEIEHFMPMVVTFTPGHDGSAATPYMIGDDGQFVLAPQYNAEVTGEWLRSLLPANLAAALRPELAYA